MAISPTKQQTGGIHSPGGIYAHFELKRILVCPRCECPRRRSGTGLAEIRGGKDVDHFVQYLCAPVNHCDNRNQMVRSKSACFHLSPYEFRLPSAFFLNYLEDVYDSPLLASPESPISKPQSAEQVRPSPSGNRGW